MTLCERQNFFLKQSIRQAMLCSGGLGEFGQVPLYVVTHIPHIPDLGFDGLLAMTNHQKF